MPILIGLAVVNLILGTWVSELVLYKIGDEGQATVTGSHGTGIVYNVTASASTIRTSDGRTTEALERVQRQTKRPCNSQADEVAIPHERRPADKSRIILSTTIIFCRQTAKSKLRKAKKIRG